MLHQDLTSGDVRAQLRRIALPAAVGMFCNTLFNLTDQYFAGKLSTAALAGLSISFPVFFSIIATGAGLGAGTTALIAHALGRKDEAGARLLSAQALTFGAFASLLLMAFGFLGSRALFRVLGADGAYLEDALDYVLVIFAGTPFFIGSYAINAGLVARGDTVSLRNTLAFGAVANVALNPWFMYGGFGVPAMGVSGIALATIVIQAIGCVYMATRAHRAGLLGGFSLAMLRPRAAPFAAIFRQGAPSALNHMTIGIGIFVITYFVSRFGGDAVAAYGLATRIEQVVLLPVLGLTSATLAIAGQSLGANRVERVREVWHAALREGCQVMLVGGLLLFFGARPVMNFFTDDAAVIATGVIYMRITVFVSFAYVFLFVTTSLLQAVQRPMYALWIGLYRQIAAPLVIYSLATSFFGLTGLWFGIGFVTWTAGLFTIYWGHRELKSLKSSARPAPLPTV